MRLLVVIVNYRTADLVASCLSSIAAQRFEGLRAVVVDNASPDLETARKEAAKHGPWVSILANPVNGGFAAGCNAAIRRALGAEDAPDYLLLLNPDTLLEAGALRALVAFMDAHPRAGIAGSQLLDARGEAECSAHRAPSPLGELEAGAALGLLTRALQPHRKSPTPVKADWVSGASLIVRRATLEEVGLLDEGYFLYFEEVDFCARARAAGWEVWLVPASRVLHLEGAATGIREAARRRPRYWFESRRRYFVKHFGVRGLLAADALWALGRASLVLRRALRLGRGGGAAEPPRFARDLLGGDLAWMLRRTSASS
jgi:GT2 family glycosyltransferase